MTYLKILSYARRGIRAEIDNYRVMQEKALAGAGAHPEAKSLADGLQSRLTPWRLTWRPSTRSRRSTTESEDANERSERVY